MELYGRFVSISQILMFLSVSKFRLLVKWGCGLTCRVAGASGHFKMLLLAQFFAEKVVPPLHILQHTQTCGHMSGSCTSAPIQANESFKTTPLHEGRALCTQTYTHSCAANAPRFCTFTLSARWRVCARVCAHMYVSTTVLYVSRIMSCRPLASFYPSMWTRSQTKTR